MPESIVDGPGGQPLNLEEDFPPVATATWEAAIQKDLKGVDYERKLVWRTEEGLAVRPYYRSGDLAGLDGLTQSRPAQFPFFRGSGKPWEIAADIPARPGAIRADAWHEAGAHAVQELGYALAAGVERLAERAADQSVDTAARELEFVFASGPTYFLEIAKLRAARLLWAQAVAAFGPADRNSCLMRLAVRTSRRNKSVYDCNTNLLRVTTEALSAAAGGCDRLMVEPFGFEPHLAVNLQRILKEEAHVDAVSDPAGGSYYIEALTDALAREAWKLFQQVEQDGGYGKAVASGSVDRAIGVSRAAREKAVSTRRRTLVGVNNYPNLKEKTPEMTAPEDHRLAVPFERIRQRTARHARVAGRYPMVLLLKHGDLKMRMARANFSMNFLGCAGFDIVQSEEYDGVAADLIVLCSSDAEYLVLAEEICPRVSAPVWVAGNPKDQIETLKAAGVRGFIHVMSDVIQTLTEWQDLLGMEA